MVRYRGRSWRCRHAATGGGGLSGALRRGCRRSLYRRATGRELRAHRTPTAVCGAASGSGRPDRSIGRVEARGSAMPGVTANGNGFWKDSEEIPKTGLALGAIVTVAIAVQTNRQPSMLAALSPVRLPSQIAELRVHNAIRP